MIAEDAEGQRRLDVIQDPEAPDGFRVEGKLRLPLDLGTMNGDPGAIRTRDPQLRRLVLYPAELPGHLVGRAGIEPSQDD